MFEPLKTWSGARTQYPRDKSIATLFEEIVATYPDNVAVVFGDVRISYAELNARANRVAHRLRGMGIGPESIVACCIERSIGLVVALLGILKAGGAYVPLDPAYPRDRLKFILDDTRASLVLTTKYSTATSSASLERSLSAIEDLAAQGADADIADPIPAAGPRSLAYVMYTSGSTGCPKGVLVENRAIVRLVRNTSYCRFAPDEVFLQFAPISFDASTFEIWGPLLNGGRLVVAPPTAASFEDLGKLIGDHGVTTLWLTAGLFHAMVEEQIENLRPLRQLLAGGDVLSRAHVQTFLERLPHCTLINGYGPTENTTFTCCHVMRSGDSIGDSVPIGRPISNTQVFILDEHLRPVPPGTTGELWAAGDGLARGYLNEPGATEKKFLKNPFSADPCDRIYRTGDMARWRADGVIEFIGRIDHQVKILGYRIEPGEIEAVLGRLHGVKQIHVVAQNVNGSKRLVAFYVPAECPAASPKQLREVAAERLPAYMIPANFVELSAMPLSPNGKVDRRALAQMTVLPNGHRHAIEAPQSQLEKTLQELWGRILRVPHISLDENFFDLGGDSLLLVAVHSNLQKLLKMEIPVTDLFEFTTIRKLAQHLEEQKGQSPLSDIQQRAQRQRDAFASFRETHTGGQG